MKKREANRNSSLFLEGGDYLLFRFRSTIGVMRFNFSVRDGKRWSPHAIFTLVSFIFVLRLSFTFGSVFDFRTFPRGSLAVTLWRRELCIDFPGDRHRASNPTRLGFFFFPDSFPSLLLREALAGVETLPTELRAISTARLNMSPCLHLRPIHVVVSDGPQ